MRPTTWIPTLFATEAIPSVLITFVSFIMFLQMKVTPEVATMYCGLLSLPWVLKSFVRAQVKRVGFYRTVLLWIEWCMFITLSAIALYFPRHMGTCNSLFAAMFGLSVLCAWHELAARMYYERMLFPRYQRFYNSLKTIASQTMTVVTYGMLIVVVSYLQVAYRNIPHAWSMGCYLLAGAILLMTLYHMAILQRPPVNDATRKGSMVDDVRAEMNVISRIRRKPQFFTIIIGLFLMLLPQGLMFYTRVLFLLSPVELGGLSCSIQEVGLAQGTIGVIAFSLGIAFGRRLLHWVSIKRVFWWMAIPLGISPLIYVLMTFDPPSSLLILCVATFQAQFCFGFGLNLCMSFVHYLSGERYRNTINYLYVPVVAASMCLPIMVSGWLVQHLGFKAFFILDALTAPLSWLYLGTNHMRRILSRKITRPTNAHYRHKDNATQKGQPKAD